MKILWIVAVLLSKRNKTLWITGSGSSHDVTYTHTVSWRYCESENEAYAEAVKYALREKPGFSIEQVTVASSDEFVLETEMSHVVRQLEICQESTEMARTSSNAAWEENAGLIERLKKLELAVKVAVVQLFADHKEDTAKAFSCQELAQFSADTKGLQDTRVEDIYREVLIDIDIPTHPATLPESPLVDDDIAGR